MKRRQFLASAAAASAAAAVGASRADLVAAPDATAREFYQLRQYTLARGPQATRADNYFRTALVPALNRLGVARVGVFNVAIGPDMPTVYVLIPSGSADLLASIDSRLWQDAAYVKAGGDFLKAPAAEPPFVGLDVWLMQAFDRMPTLRVPARTADHPARVYELRTYKSPTEEFHRRKVEMFNSAEMALQATLNMGAVFYGDVVAGPHMPSLTYMLAFDSLADREKKFQVFQDSMEWQALSNDPKYPSEIVATVTAAVMSPATYSQI